MLKRIKQLLWGILIAAVFQSLVFSSEGKTLLGIDVLEQENFEPLSGSSVALITNQTGVNRKIVSTVDLLHRAKNLKLVCVMTPEHGFRGDKRDGENIENTIDERTGVPVYSLYGKTSRPTADMLKGVNTIVFDIQDIGTRFYTYVSSMGMALEEAAARHLRFFVLDRPNPIRGDIIEGDILDTDIKRMTGFFPMPVRHGLTVGEIAWWTNESRRLGVHLEVIKMKNWSRSMWFENTGLVFTPPSPNMRTLTAALLYPGIGCFEATNVSVGRGTDTPFELFGAPWVNARGLTAHLREQNYPGVLFNAVTYTPTDDLYKGELCHGVRITVTDRAKVRAFDIFVEAFLHLIRIYPHDFKPEWEEVRVVTGSNNLRLLSENKMDLEGFRQTVGANQEHFRDSIKTYYLYPSH